MCKYRALGAIYRVSFMRSRQNKKQSRVEIARIMGINTQFVDFWSGTELG